MQNRRFRADITNRNGGRIAILSTSKQTAALMEPQAGYRGFIMQLHRRLADAGSDATLGAGLRPGTYRLLVSAVVFFGIAMAVLLVRALATGEFAGVIFILGFAALFAWQIGGFIRRNRSRNYTFVAVPQNLLP
jgi:predicted anti-sigma-YlaC factor YlaD